MALDDQGRTPDEALVVDVLAVGGPLTVHGLSRWSGLTLGRTLFALRGLLSRGDVVMTAGARYALDEVRDE